MVNVIYIYSIHGSYGYLYNTNISSSNISSQSLPGSSGLLVLEGHNWEQQESFSQWSWGQFGRPHWPVFGQDTDVQTDVQSSSSKPWMAVCWGSWCRSSCFECFILIWHTCFQSMSLISSSLPIWMYNHDMCRPLSLYMHLHKSLCIHTWFYFVSILLGFKVGPTGGSYCSICRSWMWGVSAGPVWLGTPCKSKSKGKGQEWSKG